MIKNCRVCGHTGELTWRDGKYYCAMCGSEIAEYEPNVKVQVQTQPEYNTVVQNVECPICKNQNGNTFDGEKYRCALCGTAFQLGKETHPVSHMHNGGAKPAQYSNHAGKLKKDKDLHIGLGILFVFVFWPVSIYFFYKAYKFSQELKDLGY